MVKGAGVQFCSFSNDSAINADGHLISFFCNAIIYVRDRVAGTTSLASVNNRGAAGNRFRPAINTDGRFVTFDSDSPLVLEDTNFQLDLYIRELP